MTDHISNQETALDPIRELFARGDGVIVLAPEMSDADLVAAIRCAASFGKPFKVIPDGFVYIDGMGDKELLQKLQHSARAAGRKSDFFPILL